MQETGSAVSLDTSNTQREQMAGRRRGSAREMNLHSGLCAHPAFDNPAFVPKIQNSLDKK
eukprot:380498-Amphidinium_carterae.1